MGTRAAHPRPLDIRHSTRRLDTASQDTDPVWAEGWEEESIR